MATTTLFQTGISPTAGYAGCRATDMDETAPLNIYRDTGVWAGRFSHAAARYRGFVGWDVSAITPPVVVTAATVTLWFTAETVTTDYAVGLYQMLKTWTQPRTGYKAAIAPEPCWSWNIYDTVAWGTAGAGGEDVDVDTDVGASAIVTSAANTPIAFTSASLAALVQGWINGTITNNGLAIRGDETVNNTTKMWATDLHATAAYRPQLSVTWNPAAGGTENIFHSPVFGHCVVRAN